MPVVMPSAVDLSNGPSPQPTSLEAPHFYLGTHIPSWLWRPEFAGVPLFVSHRRLRTRKSRFPAAAGRWGLDSGGFTELQRYGRWTVTPAEYVAAVVRYDTELGGLDWAAPQDWMCEQIVIDGGRIGTNVFVGTGLTVVEHQVRTVANFIELCDRWSDLSDEECPFMPVIQGQTLAQYLECAERYESAGIRLSEYVLVGIGSVCRRQSTTEIASILSGVKANLDVDLHGFGVKMTGLELAGHHLESADSMAWSSYARQDELCVDCVAAGVTRNNCASCPQYALRWRERVLDSAFVGTKPRRDEWKARIAAQRATPGLAA